MKILYRHVVSLAALSVGAPAFAGPEVRVSDAPSVDYSGPTQIAPNATTVELTTGFEGQVINDPITQSQLLKFNLGVGVEHQIDNESTVRLKAGGLFIAGAATSISPEEDKPGQQFYLAEASIDWHKYSFFTVKAGMTPQNELASPLLFGATSFPGVQEKFEVPVWSAKLSLTTEQAIPTSNAVSVATTTSGSTPYFLLERLKLSDQTPSVFSEWDVSVAHFMFSSLSQSVAQDSRFLGNSVQGLGESAAAFDYRFQGIDASAGTTFNFGGQVTSELSASYLQNLSAPSGQNLGWIAGVKLKFPAWNFFIQPEFSGFMNESDSSPADYNSYLIDHNNHEGTITGLSCLFPKSKVTVSAKWVNMQYLRPDPYSSDRNLFVLSLEALYAIL